MKALIKKFRVYSHKLLNDMRSDLIEFDQALKKDWNKIPNLFTEARLICSPIPGLILLLNHNDIWWSWTATIIFALVALTDRIDGYLARRLNQVTRLGEALDPVVDKVLISLTLISLIITSPLVWIKMSMVIIVVCEIIVIWLSFRAKHQETAVAVTRLGKAKMTTQCIAIIIMFEPIKLAPIAYQITVVTMVAITFISLLLYVSKFYIWRKSLK